MTDKEKIKEEIERRIKDYQSRLAKWSNSEYTGRCQEDKELLKFIDSLPEENNENLEEEITKCYKSRIDLMMTRKQFGELIHRFTEWQKRKDMQDFLEKADKFFNEYFNIHPHDCHVIQYVSDTPLETIDDFVEQFKNYIENEI